MSNLVKSILGIVALAMAAGRTWAAPPATSLNSCQNAVMAATQLFVTHKMAAIGGCLQAVSTQIVKNNAPTASGAATACVASFRKLNDSRGLGKQLSDKLAAAITKKCAPGQMGVTHTLADILGGGAGVPQSLHAETLNAWCSQYGGDGAIDSVNEWIACLTAATECAVDSTIAAQYPRVLEWLNLAQAAMQTVTPPATDPVKVSDAIAALAAVKGELDPNNDDVVTIHCGSAATAPSCTDGAKNGGETDQDCGGSCPPCSIGLGCTVDGDCQSGLCTANACTAGPPATCLDGMTDGDETGKDCGGSCVSLLKCGDGWGCLINGDCQSGICTANVCVPASATPPPFTCMDGVQDGDETGKDCGGSCVSLLKCADGVGCVINGDCQSDSCSSNVCVPASAPPPPPGCADGVRDFDETGPDCGGICTVAGQKCADGVGCVINGDCLSGICSSNICGPASAPPPPFTCTDGFQDGDETGKDCGGSCASLLKCADGTGCVINGDCQSGICNGNVCLPASAPPPAGVPPPFYCMDGVQDGDETGKDCGGSCTSLLTCADGAGCVINGDCQSGICSGNICLPASAPPPAGVPPPFYCMDGFQDGDETGKDCGGSCASLLKCADGTGCVINGDCQSGICNGNVCLPASAPPPPAGAPPPSF